MKIGERYEVRGFGVVEVVGLSNPPLVTAQRRAPDCHREPAVDFEPSRLLPIPWPTVGHYGSR